MIKRRRLEQKCELMSVVKQNSEGKRRNIEKFEVMYLTFRLGDGESCYLTCSRSRPIEILTKWKEEKKRSWVVSLIKMKAHIE
jgi:hypothetical protein